MSEPLKKVHDILSEKGGRRPVAFIQYGNVEIGFKYELVCPWCAKSICIVENPTKQQSTLYKALLKKYQELHWNTVESCPAIEDNHGLQVEITTVPLNTEELPDMGDENGIIH